MLQKRDLAEPFLKQVSLFDILPKLELKFNEPGIKYKQAKRGVGRKASELY